MSGSVRGCGGSSYGLLDTSWLEENINVDDLAHGLKSFKIDADHVQKYKESWRDTYAYAD